MSGSVFVTVGSTSFDALVRCATEERFIKLLDGLGYKQLMVQLGRGEYVPTESNEGAVGVSWYRYKSSLKEDMIQASLIISHGGAGCIMESLTLNKPLVVVINDELMNNHQTELARQLSKNGHLVYTNPSGLYDTVQHIKEQSFVTFEPSKPDKFGQFLNKVMGFNKTS